MNNDINDKIVHAAPVPPFVRFVASAVPMVFDNSLSYYECLCALWKWMQDNLVDVINNNATVTEHYIELDEETRQLFVELKDYVDNYFDNLDVQQEINNKLDQMVEDGTFEEIFSQYYDKLDNFSDSNVISVGSNLITDNTLWVTNGSWTDTGNGAYTHIVGQTGDLEYNYTFNANTVYVVDFDVTTTLPAGNNASVNFTTILGDSTPITVYRGGGSAHYTIALKSSTNGKFKFACVDNNDPFTPSGTFQGTISNITLREAGDAIEQLKIYDANDATSLAFSIMENGNQSVAIGEDAGVNNYTQSGNVFVGYRAGLADTTGYYNVGIGDRALASSVNSTRNIAIGASSLTALESGDRNISIGTFCQSHNKSGRQNLAIGFDTMNTMTIGSDNIAIGNKALQASPENYNQIAIGTGAMSINTYTGKGQNIAIGNTAMRKNATGQNNIAIGQNTMYKSTDCNNTIAIGTGSANYAETTNGLIAIGVDCVNRVSSGQNIVAIGHGLNGTALGSATRAVIIGSGNLNRMTALTNTVILGTNIYSDTEHTALTNVITVNSGTRTVIIDRDNYINIANAIYADITTANQDKVGIDIATPTARLHLPAGKAIAGTAPLKLTSSSGQLLPTAEDGAFEYDGTHLYFTIGATRNTII